MLDMPHVIQQELQECVVHITDLPDPSFGSFFFGQAGDDGVAFFAAGLEIPEQFVFAVDPVGEQVVYGLAYCGVGCGNGERKRG